MSTNEHKEFVIVGITARDLRVDEMLGWIMWYRDILLCVNCVIITAKGGDTLDRYDEDQVDSRQKLTVTDDLGQNGMQSNKIKHPLISKDAPCFAIFLLH